MRDIKKIVIAGSGTMGCSMGAILAQAGYEVTLYDIVDEALERAKKVIALNWETEVAAGKISQADSEKLQAGLTYTTDKQAFADADFVVEAILEKIEVKHSFWEEVSNIVGDDVVICSNTSGLSITRIAEVINKPERFAGMHWINPPHLIPLVEIIKGEKTTQETADIVKEVALRANRKPVIVGDAPGFVLNRIQLAILRESLHIVEQGIAPPEAVDDVMKYGLGIRYACLGPFQVCDLGGLDIFYNIASYLFEDLCDEKKPFGMLADRFEKGEYGVKTQKGFYDYSHGKDEETIRYRDTMFNKLSDLLYKD